MIHLIWLLIPIRKSNLLQIGCQNIGTYWQLRCESHHIKRRTISVILAILPMLNYTSVLIAYVPPDETRGIHVKSASFLFKTRGDLAEFTWFVRWGSQ